MFAIKREMSRSFWHGLGLVIVMLAFMMAFAAVAKAQPYPYPVPVPAPVPPAQVSLWTHTTSPQYGSSVMQMVQNGPAVSIFYQQPRGSLIECCGVVPGTMFFNGAWNGPVLSGYATIYHRGGWSEKYFVSGGYVAQGVLQLNGTPPDGDVHNSTLVFFRVQ